MIKYFLPMHNPAPLAIIIFGSALVFCLAFLRLEAVSAPEDLFPVSAGRILGVSEAAADMDQHWPGPDSRLPFAVDAEPAGPRSNGNISDLAVGDVSALVMDVDSGATLYGHEADTKRPIASISKLMTAMVFLEHNPGWEEKVTIGTSDRVDGGKIHVYRGDIVSTRDLFFLALTASDNTAAKALVRSTGLSDEEFIAAMNGKAEELDLPSTYFNDYVGLSAFNVSTALEVARLLKAALDHPDIAAAVILPYYDLATEQGRQAKAYNTNDLIGRAGEAGSEFVGGKTGHTNAAGYCFAGSFRDPSGQAVISVVLGGPSPSSRFDLSQKMALWAYASYEWK